jgi:hypothetical protein
MEAAMGFTRVAVSGLVLALAACEADTIGSSNDTGKFLVTASTEAAPYAEPGNARASLFAVPREARVLLLAHP